MKTIKFERVLPKECRRPLELISYKVGTFSNKDAQKALKMLPNLENNFLKRIKKTNESNEVDILLCKTIDFQKIFVNEQEEELNQIMLKSKDVEVPAFAPSVSHQYEQWSIYWPIHFFEMALTKEIEHTSKERDFIESLINKENMIVLFSAKNVLLSDEMKNCSQFSLKHSVMDLLLKWGDETAFDGENLNEYYYLKGLRLIVSFPLCHMCCMALVHSRLERIYIRHVSEEDIFSMTDVLSHQHLNHRIIIHVII